jgi:hypothetical protein
LCYLPFMTMVLRPGESVNDLIGGGAGSCPQCGGPLQKWGHGRRRVVRGTDPAGFRPPRVRCVDCRVTQVVLPADVLVRRRDAVVVVGRAWRSFAAGAGARLVARRLDVPMETVRGWLRRLRTLAPVMAVRSRPGRLRLSQALASVEAGAHAAGWRHEVDIWRYASWSTQGRLLSTPVDPARAG